MNMNKKNIVKRIEEVVAEKKLLLVEINIRGNQNNPIVEIFIDDEKGVTTDDCAELSREIGSIIEEENLIETKHRLDVSSPGIDRPLKYIQQFPKNIDRKFEIKYTDSEEKKKKFEGKLLQVEGEKLVFESGKNNIELNFTDITSAKVLISF